ncbi:MAG TPA: PepSY domain-containing protein [Steroidobacteraceae bacterium]|jgi:hypothetical protein|nr:PepSY domain-containing protein [Steroidobacteraceae bacterium]
MRWLLLLHRYLGIAVGALMVMWCVSGVVMMYVSYPALDANARNQRLVPIEWSGCCKIPDALLAGSDPIENAQIEMLAGRPVLYLGDSTPTRLIDLIAGAAIDPVSPAQAATVAAGYATGRRLAPPRFAEIDFDQWTVAGDFDADRPLYRFALNDEVGTELYVSSTSGQAVQITSGRQRIWNWLGSVPHWLYFAELRRRAWLWSQLVIYTSLIGCFLAGTGIYIGVRQMLAQPAGRWSPYRGFNFWHHLAGLIFGVLALTWVLSGLLSMNPWGWLEGASPRSERARLRGPATSGAQLFGALQAFVHAPRSDVVSLKLAPLDGRLYFIATTSHGDRLRFNAGGALAPLNDAELSYLAAILSGTQPPTAPWLMKREDPYYFSHHGAAPPLPVLRIARRDESGTRYYVDPVSGMLIAKFDRAAQGYRWWHGGLHRMDFTTAMRSRPLWDVFMLLLTSGVTFVCVTGAYLGYRRAIGAAPHPAVRSRS